MGEGLRVTAGGLTTAARGITDRATTVTAHRAPPDMPPAHQPTGPIVAAIHEAVASAAKHYGHRLNSTSAKLTAASAHYTATDAGGGAGIDAVQI